MLSLSPRKGRGSLHFILNFMNYLIGIFIEKLIAALVKYGNALFAQIKRKQTIDKLESDYKSAKTDAEKEKDFEDLVRASNPNSD